MGGEAVYTQGRFTIGVLSQNGHLAISTAFVSNWYHHSYDVIDMMSYERLRACNIHISRWPFLPG